LRRTVELTTLKHWILEEHCRLVTLLGIDGMGKTSLSVKLAEQIQVIIKWLGTNSQPASFSELRSQLSSAIPPQQLLDALKSLQEHSLVNKNATLFSVAPVVREYINHQLIQN
jgi:thymidylate kinase